MTENLLSIRTHHEGGLDISQSVWQKSHRAASSQMIPKEVPEPCIGTHRCPERWVAWLRITHCSFRWPSGHHGSPITQTSSSLGLASCYPSFPSILEQGHELLIMTAPSPFACSPSLSWRALFCKDTGGWRAGLSPIFYHYCQQKKNWLLRNEQLWKSTFHYRGITKHTLYNINGIICQIWTIN